MDPIKGRPLKPVRLTFGVNRRPRGGPTTPAHAPGRPCWRTGLRAYSQDSQYEDIRRPEQERYSEPSRSRTGRLDRAARHGGKDADQNVCGRLHDRNKCGRSNNSHHPRHSAGQRHLCARSWAAALTSWLERSVTATAFGSIAGKPCAHGAAHLTPFPRRGPGTSKATNYQPDKNVSDHGHAYRQTRDHPHRSDGGPYKEVRSAHQNANNTSQSCTTE